jgi:molybdopterin/thiamine biosynthesis adenylyltransferase
MEAFHARHQGLFDPAALESKNVFIAGAGSMGSFAAELLVRAGVRRLMVADCDTVSEANLCRTVFDHVDIGRSKVEALASHLRAIRGGLDIDARHVNLRAISDDDLGSWLAGSHLVIAATDHPPTQARLSALSYHRVPTVFPGAYARGTGGEVIWTLPEETPCYLCILGALLASQAPPRGQMNYGLASGQLAAEPALGIDVLHVTLCASKIALALLLRETNSAAARILDPGRTVLFVGNSVDWVWREPFETIWARAERRPDCVCRIAPGSSTAALLDDEATT